MDPAQPSSQSVDKNEDGISEIKETPIDEDDCGEETINDNSSEEAEPDIRVLEDIFRESIRVSNEDIAPYRELLVALFLQDWETAEDFIIQNPKALTAIISETSQTFFHVIVRRVQAGPLRLLQKYLPNVPPELLELKDSDGSTALHSAALNGNLEAVKHLVKFNKNLPKINDNQDWLPLVYAALSGHMETVKYLLSVTPKDFRDDLNPFAGPAGLVLVVFLIETNLYDVAFDLLKQHPRLARDNLTARSTILQRLASKPMRFESGSRMGYWQRLIYHCTPVQEERTYDCPQKQKNDFSLTGSADGDTENPIQNQKPQNSSTKSSPFRIFLGAWSKKLRIILWNIVMHLSPSIQAIHNKKLMHMHTVEIVRMMCAGVPWSFNEATKLLKMTILTAARMGIHEIVKEIIKAYPYSFVFVDKNGNNALMLAILHRHEKVYKLINKCMKGYYATNKFKNSILHLAATSAPASEIPGAALQMQLELQWFKAVENYVGPHLHEQRNASNKTAKEMFTEEHEKLIEKGEKWMKHNASSCTIAISLIITAVFAAAFTAPGGNDNKGIPNLLHKVAFKIFVISDGLALFSSVTSLLMFLGILTSTYAEEDFLISLPRKLIIGLITMFFSIATMMVAYGAAIYMIFSNPWKWVIIPLGCIPVTLFAMLQFPLLLQIYSSTYAPTISQPTENR